jgi:hypothetical protein
MPAQGGDARQSPPAAEVQAGSRLDRLDDVRKGLDQKVAAYAVGTDYAPDEKVVLFSTGAGGP